jgi:hypothetical protein
MRKAILFLAFGSFLAASVSAYACDGDKACSMKGRKASSAACMKAKGSKASMATKSGGACTMKDGKDCSKDPSCMKGAKASKATPSTTEKKEKAS